MDAGVVAWRGSVCASNATPPLLHALRCGERERTRGAELRPEQPLVRQVAGTAASTVAQSIDRIIISPAVHGRART